MKQDIDQRYGERIVRDKGCVKFYRHIYKHPKLKKFIGFPVIVKGYGYGAIDVYLIERRTKKRWGKGKFVCMIES